MDGTNATDEFEVPSTRMGRKEWAVTIAGVVGAAAGTGASSVAEKESVPAMGTFGAVAAVISGVVALLPFLYRLLTVVDILKRGQATERQKRHDLRDRVHGAELREAAQAALLAEMIETIDINRRWMVEQHRTTGVPLPPDFERRPFDTLVPGLHNWLDMLKQAGPHPKEAARQVLSYGVEVAAVRKATPAPVDRRQALPEPGDESSTA